MTNTREYAKIKSLLLPLREYRFDHGPSDKFIRNLNFIGREKLLSKLVLLLKDEHSNSKKGAYLVTGYRGMGKTSLVREAIIKVNNPDSTIEVKDQGQAHLHSFEVSLSQDEVQEIDLLRQIAWKVDQYIQDNSSLFKPNKTFIQLLKFLSIILGIGLSLCITNSTNEWVPSWLESPFTGTENPAGQVFMFFGLLAFVIITLINLINYGVLRIERNPKRTRFYKNKLNHYLEELKTRLFSDVTSEDRASSSFNIGNNNPITHISNKLLNVLSSPSLTKNTLNFKKASPKEIEQYLHAILMEINSLRKLRAGKGKKQIPNFVFVIDELDKIEPDYYFTPGDKESESHLNRSNIPFHVETKARRRNEAISRLLANLKNFLNTSASKFVFIGGRGMYDAALADIADRESFYSSIFNEVLYVPSFFKDKLSKRPGVTQLTESYLCFLLTDETSVKNKTNKYEYNLNQLKNHYKNQYPIYFSDEKRLFKVIHTLQNFIIYLTYRSNGSPKKLIELIEKYIVIIKGKTSELRKNTLFIEHKGSHNDKFHLKLSFKDQYEINLHSNIYRPYLIINSKHLKSLGDKLLYSSAFIIDHVLKYHKSAFSWRNLEQIPDIILSSKDPNFRQFFNEFMSFLLKQHMRRTTNTVSQYKFNSKTLNELKYSSKVSESSSAAFNFTLDESYHLKSYYKKKLAAKYQEYSQMDLTHRSSHYIYTIGFLHGIIGDIHYYDEEFDDAIIHYSDALQFLKEDSLIDKPIESHKNTLLVRISLNLGICFEKTRMYDRAYSHYRSLTLHLRNWTRKPANITNGESLDPKGAWEKPFRRMQLFQRPHLALLGVIEKDRQDGITYDNLERNLTEYIQFLNSSSEHPKNEELYLFPLNRSQNGTGIYQYEQVKNNAATVENINQYSDKKRVVTLLADYYLSVGSMLFYKNQIFWRLLYGYSTKSRTEVISDKIIQSLSRKSGIYHPSHSSYLYYLYSLITFNVPYKENIDNLINECKTLVSKPKNELSLVCNMKFVTNYFHLGIYEILNSDQYDFLGNILSKLGDAVLGCLENTTIHLEDAINFTDIFVNENISTDHKSDILKLNNDLSLTVVFALYRLAYLSYKRANKEYSAIFQYKKLLYVLKDSITSDSTVMCKNLTESKIDTIAGIILKFQTTVSGVSAWSQLEKYRKVMQSEEIHSATLYNNLSTAPEIKEIVLLIESLKIKLGLKKTYDVYIGPYSTVSSMFTRILELKFKVEEDLFKLKDVMAYDKLDYKALSRIDESDYEVLKHHLTNSLFSMYEIQKSLKTYGITYILNYSFNASMYYRMAKLCSYYNFAVAWEQENNIAKENGINNSLTDILGSNFHYSLDPHEYLDLAKHHYNSAISLHSEGSKYKEISKEMYLLDDDYNDNLTHFCAAAERYRINTGRITAVIKKIDQELDSSDLFKTNNYVF